MKLVSSSAAIVTVGLLAAPLFGQYVPGEFIIDPQLPGQTSYDGWLPFWNEDNGKRTSSLTQTYNPGYPKHPGSDPWPNPITSKQGSAGHDAGLMKIANGTRGGAYPGDSSLYFGGLGSVVNNFGGTVSVFDDTPVANLATVVFQIDIGEVWLYDFYDSDNDGNVDLPVLNY